MLSDALSFVSFGSSGTCVAGSGTASGVVVTMMDVLGLAGAASTWVTSDGGGWTCDMQTLANCAWDTSTWGTFAFVGLAVLAGTRLSTRAGNGPVPVRDLRVVRMGPVKLDAGVDAGGGTGIVGAGG
jgi:hypothetical protein